VTFIDLGGDGWLDLDVDEILTVDYAAELEEALVENRAEVAAAIGSDYEVHIDDRGRVFVITETARRFEVEIDRNGRLVFTGVLDPEGPL